MINTQTYIKAVLNDTSKIKPSSKPHRHRSSHSPTIDSKANINANAQLSLHPSQSKLPTYEQPAHVPKPPTEPQAVPCFHDKLKEQHHSQKSPSKVKDKSRKAARKMEKVANNKSPQQLLMQSEESPMEAASRRSAGFDTIENQLTVKRFAWQDLFQLDKISGKFLGQHNPFAKKANPREDIVWLFDNTAYRPIHPYDHAPQPWQAEFVASYFKKGRTEADHIVSNIADLIGIDGKVGAGSSATLELIEKRVSPFIHAVAPARSVDVTLSMSAQVEANAHTHALDLGPSDSNGISSQVFPTGGHDDMDGKTITITSAGGEFPLCKARMRYAGPEGWGIISDIDDTIKVTQTVNPTGILTTTFAEEPKTTTGMPEFYKILNEQFQDPAWFYLSASPYNLYPFLHQFINDKYLPGTIILRDASWMYLGGLLQCLTQGVKPYKVDRMHKINSWLPKRKMICIGDSTQMDPESYAEIYKKYPGWIHAIYIRKVVDAPHMEDKNKDERFTKAFEGVDAHVWKVFQEPDELAEHVKHLAGGAHMGLVGALQGYFCKQEQAIKKA
jgi:phosphatidate phosphatase APP1